MISRLQRNRLIHEIGLFLKAAAGKKNDPFGAYDVEDRLRAAIYAAWQARVDNARMAIAHVMTQSWMGLPQPGEIMHAMNAAMTSRHFGSEIAGHVQQAMKDAIAAGKASTDHDYKKQTGQDAGGSQSSAPSQGADLGALLGLSSILDDISSRGTLTSASAAIGTAAASTPVSFGVIFGLTEDHAIAALKNQMMIAAGGFFDDEMSASIRREVESWFTGALTKDELSQKLTKLVNERLSIDGAKSLPGSYFDGLTEHYIVRARNVGSVYRAKALGATSYSIVNPRDSRTSGICMTLSQPGKTFPMHQAESRVEGILGARSQEQLKAVAPFLTDANAADAEGPVPQLHWRCRSWMKYYF